MKKKKSSRMTANNKYDITAPNEDVTTVIKKLTGASLNPEHEQQIDLRKMNEQDIKSMQTSGE
jgi:hypothetical protein